MALIGIVGLFGLLIGAVFLLGSSSEPKFVPVGQTIEGSGSPPSGSSGSTKGGGPVAEHAQAGLLLSEDDLTEWADLGPADIDLELSEVADTSAINSICTGKTVEAVTVIVERWTSSAWEIDLTVADYATESIARSQIQEKQTPEFLDCTTDGYEGERFGSMNGKVVDQDQHTEPGAASSGAQVDGRSDICPETTMVVQYRQVGTATVSARLFSCTGEEGDERDAPTFDLDAADQLTAIIADRLGG